jgi:hypothetical protein
LGIRVNALEGENYVTMKAPAGSDSCAADPKIKAKPRLPCKRNLSNWRVDPRERIARSGQFDFWQVQALRYVILAT